MRLGILSVAALAVAMSAGAASAQQASSDDVVIQTRDGSDRPRREKTFEERKALFVKAMLGSNQGWLFR